jgi:hypothetical protein
MSRKRDPSNAILISSWLHLSRYYLTHKHLNRDSTNFTGVLIPRAINKAKESEVHTSVFDRSNPLEPRMPTHENSSRSQFSHFRSFSHKLTSLKSVGFFIREGVIDSSHSCECPCFSPASSIMRNNPFAPMIGVCFRLFAIAAMLGFSLASPFRSEAFAQDSGLSDEAELLVRRIQQVQSEYEEFLEKRDRIRESFQAVEQTLTQTEAEFARIGNEGIRQQMSAMQSMVQSQAVNLSLSTIISRMRPALFCLHRLTMQPSSPWMESANGRRLALGTVRGTN